MARGLMDREARRSARRAARTRAWGSTNSMRPRVVPRRTSSPRTLGRRLSSLTRRTWTPCSEGVRAARAFVAPARMRVHLTSARPRTRRIAARAGLLPALGDGAAPDGAGARLAALLAESSALASRAKEAVLEAERRNAVEGALAGVAVPAQRAARAGRRA